MGLVSMFLGNPLGYMQGLEQGLVLSVEGKGSSMGWAAGGLWEIGVLGGNISGEYLHAMQYCIKCLVSIWLLYV